MTQTTVVPKPVAVTDVGAATLAPVGSQSAGSVVAPTPDLKPVYVMPVGTVTVMGMVSEVAVAGTLKIGWPRMAEFSLDHRGAPRPVARSYPALAEYPPMVPMVVSRNDEAGAA